MRCTGVHGQQAVAVNAIWGDPDAFSDCLGIAASVVDKVKSNVLNLAAWREELGATKDELRVLQLLGASLMGEWWIGASLEIKAACGSSALFCHALAPHVDMCTDTHCTPAVL